MQTVKWNEAQNESSNDEVDRMMKTEDIAKYVF